MLKIVIINKGVLKFIEFFRLLMLPPESNIIRFFIFASNTTLRALLENYTSSRTLMYSVAVEKHYFIWFE